MAQGAKSVFTLFRGVRGAAARGTRARPSTCTAPASPTRAAYPRRRVAPCWRMPPKAAAAAAEGGRRGKRRAESEAGKKKAKMSPEERMAAAAAAIEARAAEFEDFYRHQNLVRLPAPSITACHTAS